MSLAEVHPPMWRDRAQSPVVDDGLALQGAVLDGWPHPAFDDVDLDAVESRPRKFDIAFQAFGRGAESLDNLQARCQLLQSELQVRAERHRLELEAARQDTAQWRTLACDMNDRFQRSQARLAEAERVTAQQEVRLAAERERVEAAERRTEAFEQIANAFHDSILSAFRATGSSTG